MPGLETPSSETSASETGQAPAVDAADSAKLQVPGWMASIQSASLQRVGSSLGWQRLPLSRLLPTSYGQLSPILISVKALEGGDVPTAIQTSQQRVGRILVDLSDRKVYLYVNGDRASEYDVAIGRKEWETPVGQYRVGDMQKEPAWEHPLTGRIIPPGPENPLGAAWISFWADGDYSFGLHGTLDESLMGEAVSHGCVRMRNDDILALYAQIQPGWPLDVVR